MALGCLLAPSSVRAQCPSYTTCAFQPVPGTNPDDAELNRLFERAAANRLGEDSVALPMLESGVDRTRVEPEIACVILKPIAAAESAWQQFCPGTDLTVISFDCGFGLMQACDLRVCTEEKEDELPRGRRREGVRLHD